MNARRAFFKSSPLFAASSALLLGTLVSVSLPLSGCGGATPPPPAPPPNAPVAASPPAAPADLSAVPEPEHLIVLGRLSKPSEALKVVGGWTHMPMPSADAIATMATGDAVAGLLDLDQPIDFALEGEARGMAIKSTGAISIAVRSMDAAKAALGKYKLTPAANGALQIEGLGLAPDDGDDGAPHVCWLAPSFGVAATRLVCSDSKAGIEALAPYLTRTAPRTAYPADVHFEARVAPLRPAVEKAKRAAPLILGTMLGIHRGGAPAIEEAFTAGVADIIDFSSDTEKLALDVMLADPQGTVTLTANYKSTTSLLARLTAGHPERAAAPPETFWRLPGDAEIAFFHRGIDAQDFEHPRDRLAAILGGAAQKEGLASDPDRKALEAAASHTLDLLALPSVYAKGVDASEAQKALAALKAVKTTDVAGRMAAERAALEQVAGWSVMGVDEAPAKVAKIAKEWPAALSRPAVAKWLKTQSTDAPPPVVANAPLPKGITLGKDAAHVTVTIHRPRHAEKGKGAPPAQKPLTLHLLVVPDTDGTRTWLVLAADEATLVAKAKGLLAPDASSLGKHGGFEAMREAKINAGGFVSPRGLADGMTLSWLFGQRYESLHDDVFAGLGTTAMPFTFTAQAGSGGTGGTFVATATLPRAAIEDIVRTTMR